MNQTICYDCKFDEKDQILIDPKYLKEGLFDPKYHNDLALDQYMTNTNHLIKQYDELIKEYDVKDMSEFSRMPSVRCNVYKTIKKNTMGKIDFKDERKSKISLNQYIYI